MKIVLVGPKVRNGEGKTSPREGTLVRRAVFLLLLFLTDTQATDRCPRTNHKESRALVGEPCCRSLAEFLSSHFQQETEDKRQPARPNNLFNVKMKVVGVPGRALAMFFEPTLGPPINDWKKKDMTDATNEEPGCRPSSSSSQSIVDRRTEPI